MQKMLMGNEAIAYGAVRAGVGVVSGYPGTPSTEVLETAAKLNDGSFYVEWSTNEKAALEVAAGASYAGVRTLVTMKQVGLNVASDPLMSLVYVGTRAGMVILVADDPGPMSSQTEQDTRHFGKYANVPVFDPTSVEEAYEMIQDAYRLSEEWQLPVFFRPTTRICHGCAVVDVQEEKQPRTKGKFTKDSSFVIFPALSRRRHSEIEAQQYDIAKIFSAYRFNTVSGSGDAAVVASGISYAYAKEAMDSLDAQAKLVKITTPFPFPTDFIQTALDGVKRVLVAEELDPVVEEALHIWAHETGATLEIRGKMTGDLPKVSEFSFEIVQKAIADFLGLPLAKQYREVPENLPVRPPVLCAGCPHRASFYAVKRAMRGEKAVFTGDIGCYTLGNAKPLDMCDTCLCMGASVTIAQGLKRAEPDTKLFAFIGDSTFFHTGIPGVVNAIYNKTNITLVVLDNATTAMTGHQPHPGIGRTMMNETAPVIDIPAVLSALGVGFVEVCNPFEQNKAIELVQKATAYPGVSAIVFRAPCIALFKKEKTCRVTEDCKKCGICLKELGCPAMSRTADGRAMIEPSLCNGCGLCRQICPFEVICDEI